MQTTADHAPLVDVCPLTKVDGRFQSFHDTDALNWPETTVTIATAK